jgi:hypothetical protein
MKVVIDNQNATHDGLLAVSNALQETNDKPIPTGHAWSGWISGASQVPPRMVLLCESVRYSQFRRKLASLSALHRV